MNVLRVFQFANPEQRVRFDTIAPAGFRILAAVDAVAKLWSSDVFITSGTEGTHSGPNDPHKTGEAYDFECRLWPYERKRLFVQMVLELLVEHQAEHAENIGNQWFTSRFFGQIEDLGGPNEHIHIQRRKGTVYP